MFKNFQNLKLEINLVIINLLIVIIFPYNFANLDDYNFQYLTLISLIVLFIVTSFLCIIFAKFLKKIFLKLNFNENYLFYLIKFILLWIFLTGIFFPVTGDHDPFLNLSLSISKKYEILLKFFLIFILFYFFEKKEIGKLFYIFINIYIIINLVFIFSKVDFTDNNLFDHKINKFGNKNLIVLSFDGITGYKMLNELKSNDDLKNNLKDFIFYTNVTTAWPATNGSINAEINGRLLEPNSNLFYDNILNDKKLDVSVYSYYANKLLNKQNGVPKGGYKKYSNSFNLNKFIQTYFTGSIGRWGTPVLVTFFEPIFHYSFYKKFINLISFETKNKLNPFESINTILYSDLYEYDLIFNDLVYDENLNDTVRMYHFSFSHWPVLVNENCDEVRNMEVNSFEHENIVLKCVSKKIIKFLESIKKEKIYENSMIVIKSDHGKPNYVQKSWSTNFTDIFKKRRFDKYHKDYPHNLKINNSFYWGYARYKPFIMIKDKNINKKEIKILEKQVFLHDLSSTYCNFFYKEDDCNKYKRNNLVKNSDLFQQYNYDIYLPKNEKSFTNINDFTYYEISNLDSFLDFLKSKGLM